MAPVPVVCDSCGTLFFAQNLIGGPGSATVTFSNVGYGPCPVCGGTGRVLDGTYQFVGDTARLLSGPEWTHERLRRVYSLLHELAHTALTQRPAAAQDVFTKLEKEEPSLAVRFKPKSSVELAAWLTLLLMIVQTLLGFGAGKTMSEKDVERVIRVVIEQAQHPTQSTPAPTATRPHLPPRKRHKAAKKKRTRR